MKKKLTEADWRFIVNSAMETFPPELVNKFAYEEASVIRLAVSRFPDLTEQAIKDLANDKIWQIRANMTRHPKMTKELILQLSNDPDGQVKLMARQHELYKDDLWEKAEELLKKASEKDNLTQLVYNLLKERGEV